MNKKIRSKPGKDSKTQFKEQSDPLRESKIAKKKAKRGASNFLLTTYQMIEVR